MIYYIFFEAVSVIVMIDIILVMKKWLIYIGPMSEGKRVRRQRNSEAFVKKRCNSGTECENSKAPHSRDATRDLLFILPHSIPPTRCRLHLERESNLYGTHGPRLPLLPRHNHCYATKINLTRLSSRGSSQFFSHR